MKLNVKEISSDILAEDIVNSAQEALDACAKVMELGVEIDKMTSLISDLEFARDSIKANGAEWFAANFDAKAVLGNMIGLEEVTTEKYVSVAEEGLSDALRTAWDKVCAFFDSIVEWFKKTFSEHKAKAAEADVEQAKADIKATETAVANAPDSEKIQIKDVVIKNPKQTSWIKRILHLNKAETSDNGDLSTGTVKLSCMQLYVSTIGSYVDNLGKNIPQMTTVLEKIKSVKNEATFKTLVAEMDKLFQNIKDSDEMVNSCAKIKQHIVQPKDGEFSLDALEIRSIADINRFVTYCDQVKNVVHTGKFNNVKSSLNNLIKSARKYQFSGNTDLGQEVAKYLIHCGTEFGKISTIAIAIQTQYDNYMSPLVKTIADSYKKASKK